MELVTKVNRHRYTLELEDMFRLRYRAAIEMGWNLPNAINGRDEDQFDRFDTVYVLDFDADRNVIGCGRVNPTTSPTLLSEIFPEYCETGVPSDPNIYEYSRCMLSLKDLGPRKFVQVRARINVAVNEYCLKAGIPKVAMLTYKRHYPLITRNWRTRPLGLPREHSDDQATYIACISDMTDVGLKNLMKSQHVKEPVLKIGDGFSEPVQRRAMPLLLEAI